MIRPAAAATFDRARLGLRWSPLGHEGEEAFADQRAFSGTADSADHDKSTEGEINGKIPQVVHLRAGDS